MLRRVALLRLVSVWRFCLRMRTASRNSWPCRLTLLRRSRSGPSIPTVSSTGAIVMQFRSPIVINPGERCAIELRNYGTVTTLGNLLITVTPDGAVIARTRPRKPSAFRRRRRSSGRRTQRFISSEGPLVQ